MAGGQNIEVTVVVSGAPLKIRENLHQKVEHLIREALREAGIPQPNLEDWTLRSADGGAAIDSDLRIGEAGIADGATVFLDPDEGGGGQIAATPQAATPPSPPVLVDPEVSRSKLASQLADWRSNKELYHDRGWHLLGHDDLQVDIAFSVRLPIGPFNDLAAIPLAVRFGFENYDVWAPSVRLIDPITRRWLQIPRLRALDFNAAGPSDIPLDLFVNQHPDTGHAFLCKPGVREYHSHFEHTGDDWLLYRDQGFGTLAHLCNVLWRATTRTVAGLNFISQRIPLGNDAALNFGVELRQEDIDQLGANVQAQMPQVVPVEQVPAEIQAQLPPDIQKLFAQQQ
jgi:hypothetical protein